jgi:TonB-linked SusC/RagA family outer membrane protein
MNIRNYIILLCLFLPSLTLLSQQNLNGIVTSADDGMILPGVNIVNQKSGQRAITNMEGKYSIAASMGDSIIYTFIGMERNAILYYGQPEENIILQPQLIQLEELVLIGYSYQRKSVVTGAIASVKSEDINKTFNLGVQQALQGKVAGVQISSTSGQPGEPVAVYIRGTSTTGNSGPLYIVDGLPSGNIDNLNPSDIESIEVLKDAASASIYGARGANGVVLIQTKTGKIGAMQVNYNMYYGLQNPTKKIDLLNAGEYGIIMNEAANNAGRPRIFDNPGTLGEGTDWQEEIFYRNAPVMEQQFSVSGGSEKSSYLTSFGYFNQDGIVGQDKSNFERYSFRINTDQRSDRFTFGTRLNYTNIKKIGIAPNQEYGQPLSSSLNLDPITPVINEDGLWGESAYVAQEIVNPVAQLDIMHQKYKIDKVAGSFYAELELIKNLKIRSNFGVDYAYDVSDSYQPVYRLNSSVRNDVNSVGKSMNRWYTWNWDNTILYTWKINENSFSALAGTSASEHKGENLGGSKEGLIVDDPNQAYINLAKNEDSERANGGAWQSALLSYFGQVHYSFNEKYLMTATVRADGSSKFGSKNKYAIFPSLSVGWNLSNENFFGNIKDKVNYAKLRLSWGQNGNQEIGDYKYTSLIVANSNYYFGDTASLHNGAQPSNLPNPGIKWETSTQTNIGIDLRFFRNRMNLTMDWYLKKTGGLLVAAPIPGYIGNYSPTINAGDVRNTGVEIEFGYKNHIEKFNYSISYNFSYNNNKVTYLGNNEGIIHGSGVGTSMTDICRAEVGYPIAYFWGYETDGVFQNWDEVYAYSYEGQLIQPYARPGDFRFKDNNGDGEISDEDRTMIGNPTPDFFTGLNISLDFKGFDLNIFFQGAFGQQNFYGVRRNDLSMANYDTDILNRWLGENSTNEYPRVTLSDANGNFSKPSDYFVEDASYVRLKNVQFGYTFPVTINQTLKIKSIRLYLAAQNYLTLTKYKGYDPEIGARSTLDSGIDRGVYPQAKTIMVGANINF